MRPRTSDASQPSQAQATPASSNHYHTLASAPPPADASHNNDHDHDQHHRESAQQHPQEHTGHAQNLSQTSYDPVYYNAVFPVIPSSYYDHAITHDEYDDYEDYDDDEDEDEDDAEEEYDEEMDMSDSDGGAPLDHVMTVTSILSPMPENETPMSFAEAYLGNTHGTHQPAHEIQPSPAEPPPHMVSHWTVPMAGGPAAAFDPAGPFHPTPLNTIGFHPMMNPGGMDDDDDEDDGVSYPPVAEQLQMFQVPAPALDEEEAAWQAAGPPAISNPNPSTLGPENPGLTDFLKEWTWRNRYQSRGPCPSIQMINQQTAKKVTRVQYSELDGDRYDPQGIDWEALGVRRVAARERRSLLYKNYTNRTDSDTWAVSNLQQSCRRNLSRS